MPADEQNHAFVVRIWEERRETADAPPIWRGSICDVRGGTRMYFNTLPALCTYLARQTGIAALAAYGPGTDTGDLHEPRQ